jgi:hypothetical protein
MKLGSFFYLDFFKLSRIFNCQLGGRGRGVEGVTTGVNKEVRTRRTISKCVGQCYFVDVLFGSTPSLSPADLTCYTERRKSKRER